MITYLSMADKVISIFFSMFLNREKDREFGHTWGIIKYSGMMNIAEKFI